MTNITIACHQLSPLSPTVPQVKQMTRLDVCDFYQPDAIRAAHAHRALKALRSMFKKRFRCDRKMFKNQFRQCALWVCAQLYFVRFLPSRYKPFQCLTSQILRHCAAKDRDIRSTSKRAVSSVQMSGVVDVTTPRHMAASPHGDAIKLIKEF